MSLSQDEINAMLTTNSNDIAEEGRADIMSPESIAAMLDDVTKDTVDKDELEPVEIMSPEEIAAMLKDPLDDGAMEDGSYVPDGPPAHSGATTDNVDGFARTLAKEGMLTDEEVDILGEIGNISMGAVATTMYSLLDRRVSITTPRVTVFATKDVLSVYRIPFVVATIEYVEGISGTNLLVLKIEDAALITDLLLGGDGKIETPVELNEMHLSAMSEIMNQMMGASSTSLSKLLRKTINISPPKSSQVDVGFDVSKLLSNVDTVTKISFDMEIEGLLNSELIQLIPYDLSREFAKQFMESGMVGSSDEIEQETEKPQAPSKAADAPLKQSSPQTQPSQGVNPPPQSTPPTPQAAFASPNTQQYDPSYLQEGYQQTPYQQMPYQQAPYQQAPYHQASYQQTPYSQSAYPQAPFPPAQYPAAASQGRIVDVHPMQFQAFDTPGTTGTQKGIDLVYNIPLQVTVELGKTKKEISEILEFSTGTILVLDKVAGDPVEIVVNGKLIARGEVVVIDENYGVRITAIING
jgi:flagellar motor switch protein FliN/FliY